MNTHLFPIRRALLLCGFFPFVANAALTFETNQLQLTAMAGTAEIAAAFPFRNSGDTPITISDLRTSCSCTTAEVKKPDYAPGESGRVEVRFHPGERTGMVERTITVTTTDQATATVSLRVNLIEPVSCRPQIFSWKKDAPPLEQSAEVIANGPSLIRAINLEKDDVKKFARVRLEPVEPSRRYRLAILPLNSHQSQETSLHYVVEFADGSTRKLVISTLVK